MNTTTQTPCTCANCPGRNCTCGCQSLPAQAAARDAVCACGPQCKCGPGCACAQK